uniref:Ubiquitin-like protease family profile domain-containing protein n=1 Tax=Brassica oleracea var. oleracea TaxID=109376 RepID=A0A0D3EA38_BRAOL
MWPGGDCSEPVFMFTPIPEKPVNKKHTVPRKRKESTLKPHKAGKETSVPTDQRRSTRLQASSTPTPAPSNELLEARICTLEANATVMAARITGLEATVAKLGASNERLKQKLHRKRKRSRATSLLPQFVVAHRRKSAPQAPQTNDLPGDDHHDSPNSKRRKTKQVSDGILGSGSSILSQYRAQHCASRRIDFKNHVFTDHLSVDHPSADHKSSPHHFPGPHSPLSHSHNQRSTPFLATDHNSSYHQINPHQSPDHQSPNHHSHNQRSTPLLATDHNSSDHQSPNHQTHNHPSPASGSANHNSPNHDPQSSLLYSPIPLFNPTPAATTPPTISPNPLFTPPPGLTTTPTSSPNKPAGFSTHYSTPNAFAATASFKGSTSRLIYQDPTNEHGVGEASDSSPDKTVRRVVDELNVLHKRLSRKFASSVTHRQPEKQRTITRLRHKSFHVTPSKLDFSNQFLLQLATPSQWTDSLHMAVLMHILDMHHKDVLLMENATFMPPTLTSLMQSKDRQFQAAVKKDKIRWDHRVSKLILLPAIDLRAGHVDVLDSLPSLYDEEDVQRFLRPILQMLPYLIRYLVKNNSRDLSPFTCQRRTGTYENTRSGDCGPVCAKFMELHLFGDPYPRMSGLTDAMVDKFRQQYAMEAYKTIVLPAYY